MYIYCCKVTYKYGNFLTSMSRFTVASRSNMKPDHDPLTAHTQVSQKVDNLISVIGHWPSFCHSLPLQVFADDVLTKEEQIGLLFRAKQKCENIIEAKHNIHGKTN